MAIPTELPGPALVATALAESRAILRAPGKRPEVSPGARLIYLGREVSVLGVSPNSPDEVAVLWIEPATSELGPGPFRGTALLNQLTEE